MGRKKTVEEVVLSKLQKPSKVVKSDIDYFNKYFERERQVSRKGTVSKKGRMLLKTTGEYVEYESNLEKDILSLLDEAEQIIGIKTQALALEYVYRGRETVYYPDIVILSDNGHVGVIEVKDTISMFKAKTVKKYEELERYCEEKGFYYVMLNKVDDIESLRSAEVNVDLEDYLKKLFETRKSITWASIKEVCKERKWTTKEILIIANKNNWKVQSPKSRVWAFVIKK